MKIAVKLLALGLLLGLALSGCGDSPADKAACRHPIHINVLADAIMANGHHWCRSFYPIDQYEGIDNVWIRKEDNGCYTLLFDIAHRGRFSQKKYCTRIQFTISKNLVCRKAVVVEDTTPYSTKFLWKSVDLAIAAFESLTPSFAVKVGAALPDYNGPDCPNPN